VIAARSPSSHAIFELIEQVFNRPSAPIVENDSCGGQRKVGRKNQAWQTTRAIIFYQLAPHNPYRHALEETRKNNGKKVVDPLGFAVDEAFYADFRRRGYPFL